MPLEINEIGIRLSVGGDGEARGANAAGGTAACSCDEDAAAEREALVAACVRRVLQALKSQQAR